MTATNRNVGRETEQQVARWLRGRGFTGAERAVRTGWRTAGGSSADTGDLTGTPGLCWQVKSLRPATRAETQVRLWLAETEAQRQAAGCVLGILVVRRWGTTDVGRWWAYMDLADVIASETGQLGAARANPVPHPVVPVRFELSDLIDRLCAWGWDPAPAP